MVDDLKPSPDRVTSPELHASIASRALYAWASPLFKLAKKQTLSHEDLWLLPSGDGARELDTRFEAAWADAEKQVRQKQSLPSGPLTKKAREQVFTSAVATFLGSSFFVAAPIVKLVNSTLQFTFPVLLSGCIAFIEGSAPLGFLSVTPATGFLLCCALGLVMAAKALTENLFFLLVTRAGWRLRAAITTGVFRKSLRLSAASRQQRTLGEMVNLMQLDATKLEMFLTQFHVLWDGLYQIAGYLTVLGMLIGWPTALGVVVMLLSMPMQIKIMLSTTRINRKIAKFTDNRVKAVNEAMQSMASVKMYAWESRLAMQIDAHRAQEIGQRRRLANLLAFSRANMMAIPSLVSSAAFVAYALTSGSIKASLLFAALGAFGQLRFPLMFYPMALGGLAQARVSRTRLASLLAAPEAAETSEEGSKPEDAKPEDAKLRIVDGEFWWAEPPASKALPGALTPAPAEPAGMPSPVKAAASTTSNPLGISSPAKAAVITTSSTKDATSASTTKDATSASTTEEVVTTAALATTKDATGTVHRPTLQGINLEVREGELLAIVGATGVGKSSLCAAMLGEMVRVSGSLSGSVVGGVVAYAAQSAWILNATVKENILFGEAWDEERYARVVAVCQLEQDMIQLPHGDATEIGERGITLSGGQKQRVAVARAAYARSAMCILDDVLSALDPEVASKVFEQCIVDYMSDATRVLVTNRVDLAKHCDRIVMLQSDAEGVGFVADVGSHDELLARRADYAQLLADNSVGSASAASVPDGASASSVAAAASLEAPAVPAANKASAKENVGGIMQTEERAKGAVGAGIYIAYAKYGGGMLAVLGVLGLHLITTALSIGTNLWLAVWTADAQPAIVMTATLGGSNWTGGSNSTLGETYRAAPFLFYVVGYALIGIVLAVVTWVRTVGAAFFSLRASRRLHDALVARVMRAPLSFFDTTPIGRIVSRFSKDMYSIDNDVLEQSDFFIFMVLMLLATAAVIFAATPWFALVCIPMLGAYVYFVQLYRQVSRESKRLESVARSPVFAHYSETLGGISTIRAYSAEERFVTTNMHLVDSLNEAYYLNKVADRWLAVRLELIGAVMTLCAAVLAVLNVVLSRQNGIVIDSAYVGLAGASLSGATGITGILNFVMRAFAMLEAAMTCTERVLHYIREIPQEASDRSAFPPPNSWPDSGCIELRDLSMRYRPETPLVLKGISVNIGGGQRVGIVGRTGSGKSSLLTSILRLVESEVSPQFGGGGSILIDGVDTSKIGLGELRRQCAIIPQNPACFSGTIRSNLDPFDEFSDEQVWSALERCELRLAVEQMVEGGASEQKAALAAQVAEYGENLSLGQRQLLCLARAVLRQAKILILDEATSAVDYATDAKIQSMIRTVFAGCTILVIAHRINTVIDSDFILVLGDGECLEAGVPSELLENPGSAFKRIVDESGDRTPAPSPQLARRGVPGA